MIVLACVLPVVLSPLVVGLGNIDTAVSPPCCASALQSLQPTDESCCSFHSDLLVADLDRDGIHAVTMPTLKHSDSQEGVYGLLTGRFWCMFRL